MGYGQLEGISDVFEVDKGIAISVPIALGSSFGVEWPSDACTKAADVRAKV
jgi:hypothetical protein